MKTFSRRTRSLASPSQPESREQEQGAAESFLLNSSDPFFFPEGQEAVKPRSTAPAASPASKGGGGASGRRRAGAASPAKAPAAAAPGKAPGPGAASGGARQQKAAATGSTARSTQPAAAKQRAATKAAGSLLSHRNSSSSLLQLQQKVEDGSQKQQAPTGSRPSVRSRPAGAPPAAAPAAAKPSGTSPGKRKAAAAAAKPAAAAAKPAGTSPGKRKAAEPAAAAAAAAADPDGTDTSPSKKMKKGGSSGSVRSGAAAAAGAAGAAAAGGPASGGAARPAAGAGAGGGKPAAGPRPGQQAAVAAGGLSALTRLVNPAALRDQAAATTVVQAQALGEQQSIADDALWALDGLSSGSDATVRDSLAALAEICASRRGRLALRSGNVAADILAAAGGLKVQRDPVQALGLATLLLCFCQADADAALLGRQEVAAAAAQLLKLSSNLDVTADGPGAAGSSAAATKLLAVLKERPYCGQLPAEERGSPLGVALVALSGVLNPHEGSLITDPLKTALRQAGALQAAAQVAADHAPALSDSSPTIQTVRSLWRLHKALLLLENACFACPDNEALLLEVQVRSGVEPLISTAGLVSWLVQQLGLLSRQALITGIKKDCLRALLAVLMNLTQNNPAGCAAVVDAGALAPVAALLGQMVRGGPKIKGVVAGREELAVWLDELSGCLALLINLVEHQPAWRDQLRQLQLPDTSHGGGGSSASRLQLVPLLCALLGAVAPRAKGATTPTAAATSLGRRLSLGSGEVTLDCLESVDAGGAASIVEAYGAILLGFLMQDNCEARAQAAALLPGGSLEPVVAAVERCLHFYITAGAMTKSNVESLSALLASLQQQQQQAGGAGAAGAAGAAATPGAAAGGSSGGGDSDSLSPVLE